jgi:transcriptional regulator with XRE-family HTH domain
VINKADKELRIAFGNHLRKLIGEQGFSLRGFADLADLEYSQIARIVSGQISPTISTAYKISETLGITLKDLFNFKYPSQIKK